MSRPLVFTVPGDPVAWGRARIKRTRRGGILLFTPERTRRFEERVRDRALAAMGIGRLPILSGCVALSVRAFWRAPERPSSGACLVGHRPLRPDEDNVLKAISDALNGVVYQDDAQVVRATVEKLVAAPGEEGSVEVAVASLHGEWP